MRIKNYIESTCQNPTVQKLWTTKGKMNKWQSKFIENNKVLKMHCKSFNSCYLLQHYMLFITGPNSSSTPKGGKGGHG